MKETIRSAAAGQPLDWTITGATTFGSKIEEHFSQTATRATWRDSTGEGSATVMHPAL